MSVHASSSSKMMSETSTITTKLMMMPWTFPVSPMSSLTIFTVLLGAISFICEIERNTKFFVGEVVAKAEVGIEVLLQVTGHVHLDILLGEFHLKGSHWRKVYDTCWNSYPGVSVEESYSSLPR